MDECKALPVGPASPRIQHVDSDGGTGPAEVYTTEEAGAYTRPLLSST